VSGREEFAFAVFAVGGMADSFQGKTLIAQIFSETMNRLD
jgi:hypothetical protein